MLFFTSAGVIVGAGIGLAICSDVLADRTGLGALWFGGVAVALVTSLPELVTDVSAVRRDAPGLALGDLFGSSMSNMAILAGVTLVFTRRRLLQRATLEHVLTAAIAMGLTALALVFIDIRGPFWAGGRAAGPALILVAYVVATYLIRERQAAAEPEERTLQFELSARMAIGGFILLAMAILAAGPVLARSADHLAEQTGMGDSFFGTFGLALVTSMPELSVSIAAIRIGAINLAIANLVGSNATNMALLLPLEIAYTPGDLLGTAGPEIRLAASTAILLMAIGIAAIVLRAERRRFPIDIAAVAILVCYFGAIWGMYSMRS